MDLVEVPTEEDAVVPRRDRAEVGRRPQFRVPVEHAPCRQVERGRALPGAGGVEAVPGDREVADRRDAVGGPPVEDLARARVELGERRPQLAADHREPAADEQRVAAHLERPDRPQRLRAEHRVDRPVRPQVHEVHAPLPEHLVELAADVEPARAVRLEREDVQVRTTPS